MNPAAATRRVAKNLPAAVPCPAGNPTARIDRLRCQIESAPYTICLERPRLLAGFRKTRESRSDRHPLIRRAQALAYIFSRRQPRIYDDELIVGNLGSKRISGNYYPEGSSFNILEDITRLDTRTVPLKLDLREKLELLRLGITLAGESLVAKALLKPGRLHHVRELLEPVRYFVTEQAGVSHQVGNFADIVRHGLERSWRQANTCLESDRCTDGSALDADQRAFYRALIITVNGIRAMAGRLANEATRLAENFPANSRRRLELERVAAACERVPFLPARNFQEGLQACWIMHVAMNLEDFEQGLSFGRLDQALWELYQQDIASGALSREQATELLACFELKCGESIPLYSERIDKYFSGANAAFAITVGGVDAAGADVTNELSGLILEAYSWIGTREPNIHARVHAGTPPWFLDKCMETLQRTGNRPALMGDEAIIGALQQAGMTLPHARDYGIIGCTELASQGRTYNSADAALFNLPLCLELALNEGRGFDGKRRGVVTPPVAGMTRFDDVVSAYRAQVRGAMAELADALAALETAYRRYRTTPVNSLLTEGCLEAGRDITWGSAVYDFTSIQAVGLADVGDSLHALRRIVFEEGRYSLGEFVNILKSDFRGQEALARELANRPDRFGNGDAAADTMTQLAADVFTDAVTARRNTRGGPWLAGFYSMTCGFAFGRHTGALPNGRRAGTRLSNGVSPCDGADRNGPTAMLRSVASLDKRAWGNCHVLNVKFDKRIVAGTAGRRVLSRLFRHYLTEQGGMQVQVSVLDAATLIEARKNPDAFPNLVVRVSGYSAYFRDLQPEIQDEIIARATHGLA